MRIDRLALRGFRNYQDFTCDFSPGVNLILGQNAQGKTNLLESIVYLSQGKAFRTHKERELIGLGAEFADMEASIFSHQREQSIRAVLFAARRPKQLYINGVKQKSAAGLKGLLTTVLFYPEDLLMLKKGSAQRRRWLSMGLCQLRPGYDQALEEYTHLYQQKAAALKDRFFHPDLLRVLPEYNQKMAYWGAVIISARARYLSAIAKELAPIHREFSGGKETLRLEYETVSTVTDPLAPKEIIYQQLLEHQQSHYTAELESMQCLSGPHRDDFTLFLGDMSLKAYGSQGQTRTAAISLKLAERSLFLQDTGEEPVLLLDDVLSELDPGRQDFVLNRIKTGQVFITSCTPDKLSCLGKTISIHGGALAGEE